MKNKILVIGGTGKTGRKVVQKLLGKGLEVRIGSRQATPAFDWHNKETWSAALEGIDCMYVTFQPDLAVPGALGAIEELVKQAKRSGVRKMILLSGKGEWEAQLCEQVVIHSGLAHTIVRASWFNQNFSESFLLDPILAGHVALPKADVKIPFVDTDDIANVVVEALLNEKHDGEIYELTGPRTLTFEEAIQEIAVATGRNIQFTPITLSAYSKIMEEMGVPGDYIWLINYLFEEVLDAPGNDIVTQDIEKVLGRKATDFSAYVKSTQSTGIWSAEENQFETAKDI